MKRNFSNFETPDYKNQKKQNNYIIPLKNRKKIKKSKPYIPTTTNKNEIILNSKKQRTEDLWKTNKKEVKNEHKEKKVHNENIHEYSHKIGNKNLPIFFKRTEILKAINSNQVSIISGNTGCGKSTQLPLFLYEESMNMGKDIKIICTQPRRLACVNIARRVKEEISNYYQNCQIDKPFDYVYVLH